METKEIENEEIENLFAKVGKSNPRFSEKHYTQKEWSEIGVKLFKRQVIGFCGTKRDFADEEGLAKVLMSTHLVENEREGKALIPKLVGQKLCYGNYNYIEFGKVISARNNECYRVSAYSTD